MKGIIKMNRIKKNLAFDFRYMHYSKIILALLVVVVIVNGILLTMEYQYISTSYDEYVYMENYYKENGLNIEEDLTSENYNIVENNDGTTTVDNTILYCYDTVCRSIYVATPQYSVSHILEISILVFPLLFGIMGTLLATTDYKHKIFKHKILRYGRNNYYLCKLLSIIAMVIGVIVFATFLGKISSIVFYSCICNQFPVDQFNVGSLEMYTNTITKMGVMCLISITYASIGFLLGIIFKNAIVSICAISTYLYIIPIFSEYEIKNCCYAVLKDTFDFYGLVNISSHKQIDISVAIIIIISVIMICNVISLFIIKKRSAYN